MNAKTLMLVPMLGLVGLLSACAGPMPQPNPNDAWVGLKEETQNSMLAEQLDGKNLKDGRYFQVKPGEHKLEVLLYEESTAQQDDQTCRATIDYAAFKQGKHYTLVESSLGDTNLRADLKNDQGKTVASTDNFDCMSG